MGLFCLPALVISSGLSAQDKAAKPPDASADAKAAEEALLAKGIRKLSSGLALVDETEFSALFTKVPKLKKSALDAQKALAQVEQQIENNKKLKVGYIQKLRELNVAIENAKSVEEANRLITLYKELEARIELLNETGGMEKELTAARAKHNEAREAFIEHVLAMRKLADKIRQKYITLAADKDVKAAIEKLNQASGKTYELTESRSFLSNLRSLEKTEDTVLSDNIPIRTDGSDTYYVYTVFNGKHTKELCVDSGSSIVCLPHKMAVDIGLEPKGSDEKITLVLADGRPVEATKVTIGTLRVGRFTVENVEAAVLPANLLNASPILGMSFLRHFNFEIDPENGKLKMHRIETPTRGAAPPNPPAKDTPAKE
jgi:aspartyl protease family protein